MTERRKRRWAAQNRKRANQRAAKERLRLARIEARAAAVEAAREENAHQVRKPRAAPLFRITIRCRDGERVSLAVHEGPWELLPSATAAARQVAAVLRHYRPASMMRAAAALTPT
jgi:hypothetical protein